MGEHKHKFRFHLSFPASSVTQPVLSDVVRELGVGFNIRRADIREGTGTMDLSLSGTHEQIDAAVQRMKAAGVEVGPIERDVIE